MSKGIPLDQLPPKVREQAIRLYQEQRKGSEVALDPYKAPQTLTAFADVLKESGLPPSTLEHRFHESRRWRFDYAWIAQKVALEVEGGVWTKGRHTRGKGFIADLAKYNTATCLGWRILRITPDQLCSPGTVQMLSALLLQ